ncbi:MAG: hypothetical protein UDN34_06080 [Phascolarctobacterium succinatutens]|nr:hypothetical protein [Phascolarctobacterium succinatutens]
MFIRTFNTPNWPSDFSVSDNIEGLDFYDNHWRCMNRLPDYINSDTITNLVYADGKYKDYYYVMAFVNWSKAPVILSMHQTEEEAQEKIKLLAIELNNK